MEIPLTEQYYVEKERNYKYLFLSVFVTLFIPILHGILFFWVPRALRGRRNAETLGFKPYFTFIKYFETVTQTFNISISKKVFYFQPSLLLAAALHVGINSVFAVSETHDLTYEDWYYIVSKRVGRLATAHVPIILILVAKNNLVSAATGLTSDKAVFFHKWYGRSMFITTIIHMALSLKYWLGMDFKIMVQIPPQIFGFIAFSCLGMLNLASLKFIRNMAFEFFLAQHRLFNFVMLLLAYFHNGGNHAAILLSVHLLVLDRVVGRIMGVLHKRKSPTKGLCDFEILDESTVRVSIPIAVRSASDKWYWFFLPRYGNWRAGQHVLFNCNKIALLAYHPFTIASLPDSGKMVLVIKVQRGFTRKLHKRLAKMTDEEDPESFADMQESEIYFSGSNSGSIHSTDPLKTEDHQKHEVFTESVESLQEIISGFLQPRIFNLKAGMNGPFGANYQPLTKFESVLFFSAGSGASFTLPVALDLLKTLKQRDEAEDYLYRPQRTQVIIVVAMKKQVNLQWYDHLWDEFIPFFNSGRARLALHFTQESPSSVEHDQEKNSEKMEIFQEGTSSIHEANSSSLYSTSGSGLGGVSINYNRPDFEHIIKSSVSELSSRDYRKALACVSCGPGAFNGKIKRVCEESRWLKNAPDIYCYDESFD